MFQSFRFKVSSLGFGLTLKKRRCEDEEDPETPISLN